MRADTATQATAEELIWLVVGVRPRQREETVTVTGTHFTQFSSASSMVVCSVGGGVAASPALGMGRVASEQLEVLKCTALVHWQ